MAARRMIALDLDGPCYDWERTARYMLRTYRGLDHLTEVSTSWDSIEAAVTKEDWEWLWSEGVARGLFRYGHMRTGCRVGLEKLVAMGYDIMIVTHRPKSAIDDTMDWITLFFKDIPISGVYILYRGESKTVADADILIDDKPENIDEWVSTGRRALLFDRPWNQRYRVSPLAERVVGWEGVVDALS